jgi:hypothetical protein
VQYGESFNGLNISCYQVLWQITVLWDFVWSNFKLTFSSQ